MTWLLAKLGLQLAGGAGFGKLVGVLALVAVTVVAGGASIWYVADLGKQAALAKCAAEKSAESEAKREAQAQAREANRDVIIRHTGDMTRLAAAAAPAKQEVQDYVEANPQLVLCSLNDRGLRIWNADPLAAGMPGGPGAPRPQPAQPAPRPGGHVTRAPGQPGGVEARLQSALAQAPGPGGGSPQLPIDGGQR